MENDVPMRDGYGKIIKEAFAKFHHQFLMTRWAKKVALAGEGDKVFVTAVVATDAGETILQTTAIEAVAKVVNLISCLRYPKRA